MLNGIFNDQTVVDDCLTELPPLGSFPLWSMRNVSGTEQPIREVEAVDSVYPDKGGLSAPIGGIYAVRYLDGSEREVFVPGNPLEQHIETAVFLKPNRKGDQFSEISTLMIRDPEDAVPDSLKDLIRNYETARDKKAAKLGLA